MSQTNEKLTLGDLTFEVRRSGRRKTIEIIVDRGGELILSAPTSLPKKRMVDFVQEKRFWIYTKLEEKKARRQPAQGKEFVNGEGFWYLGRSYRLLLVDGQKLPIKLQAGRFRLRRDLAFDGRRRFINWYTTNGRKWLCRRVKSWAARMGVVPKRVEVRDLGYRWGSCSPNGTINFHWATILLPVNLVDYVIVHELAHLLESNHSPAFWRCVARTLPEYQQRKTWLAEHGGEHIAL